MLRLVTFLASVAVLAGLTPAVAQGVVVGVPDNVPYAFMEAGQPKGLFVDAARAVLGKLNRPAEFTALPWARLYSDLASGKVGVALPVLATPERAAASYFTHPVLVEWTVVAVPNGKAFRFDRFEDLKGHVLGAQLGFSYPGLDEVAGIQFERVNDPLLNLKKLVAGHLDGAVVGSIADMMAAERAGLRGQIELLPTAAGKVPLGIGLAHAAFTRADADRFDSLLADYMAGADFKASLDRYGIAPLLRDFKAPTS